MGKLNIYRGNFWLQSLSKLNSKIETIEPQKISQITKEIYIVLERAHFHTIQVSLSLKTSSLNVYLIQENLIFKFKLEFKDIFAEIWLEYFKYFKFEFLNNTNHFIDFEIWVAKLIKFLSFEYLVQALLL